MFFSKKYFSFIPIYHSSWIYAHFFEKKQQEQIANILNHKTKR